MESDVVLLAERVSKTYPSAEGTLTVLNGVSLQVRQGETFAVVGPSGSGKTTLLALCAGLDEPSSGRVVLAGQSLDGLTEDGRAEARNRHVGFVFQNFQLIPSLTALENVMLPLELRGERGVEAQALELLDRVGLGSRTGHYPGQLSGGEQQRVAVARAFINKPKILFADEPTGNLDLENSHRIVDLLFKLNADLRTALVLVTHDLELAAKTQSRLRLRGGEAVSES